MINSFKNYLIEEDKTVFFTFGRMNPATVGHGMLMDKLAKDAGQNSYRIYLSQSQDAKKNPLDYTSKIKFVRKMFPRHARAIILDKTVKSVFDIATKLYDEGYKNINMMVGSDRIAEFKALLEKYDGVKGRHGFYKFNSIKILSAGERDPDAEGVAGMSASKMRGFAADNDFVSFSQGLPKSVSNADAKSMFNAVRTGMGLKEEKDFKRRYEFEPVSEERENYVRGNLFQEGDEVVIKDTDEIGTIQRLGTNYVVVECQGRSMRKWLTDVELLEKCWPGYTQVGTKIKNGKPVPNCVPSNEKIEVAQDKDIDELPGSQPATFQKGIKSKSTKAARHRHFQKMAKRDDDDPSAYKDAPGDKKARAKGIKPSQYTLKFKQMYGENANVELAKQKIEREKKADAVRHDRMLDRARTKDTKQKNRETKADAKIPRLY